MKNAYSNRLMTPMALVAVAALALTAVVAPGCDGYTLQVEQYDDWSYFGDEWGPQLLGEPLDAGTGQIAGDFGESRLETARAASVKGWHMSDYWGLAVSTIEVQAEDDRGWVSMAMLEIYGGLDADTLVPGKTYTFDIEDDVDGTFVVAAGCTGYDPGLWAHDEIAETVVFTVDEALTPGGLLNVTFEARFVHDDWTSPNYAPQTSWLSGNFQIAPSAH